MSGLKKIFNRHLTEGELNWIFIIPSAILLAIFILPLIALFARSINAGFLHYALSEQAFKALRLSLITSSITTMITIVLGTPLAFILAR